MTGGFAGGEAGLGPVEFGVAGEDAAEAGFPGGIKELGDIDLRKFDAEFGGGGEFAGGGDLPLPRRSWESVRK